MPTTLHTLIAELSARSSLIAGMGLAASLQDAPVTGEPLNLASRAEDLSRVASWVDLVVRWGGLPLADAETLVRSLLNQRNFYGTYCELGAYGWLADHKVAYRAQIPVSAADVLKANGSTIDGRFAAVDAYFDIKGMGFQEYVVNIFREKVEARLNGLKVTLDGPMDVAVKDIDQYAFPKIPALVEALRVGGEVKIDELGWTVKASRANISMSTTTLDPYCLARENRYFPFKTAGQFARQRPFVLVFTYTSKFNRSLPLNFAGGTDIVLRSMARRAFMEHSNDTTPASQFDASVPHGVSLGDASRLLSAILFINLDSNGAQMFLNPRALNKFQSNHVAHLFDFEPLDFILIDDFSFDDY